MAGQRNSYGKRSHSQSDYPENGGTKRRSSNNDRESFSIGSDDTVYRYLCPLVKIGSIIGRGGEIIKQIRADTKAKIRIDERVSNCDERVVTVYSSSQETNDFEGTEDTVCPAHEALFKVHDRIVVENMSVDDDPEDTQHVTVRLLVSSDQIGCVIGKGGQIVQDIRSETGSQIRILKDDHLPLCALASDELVQISGEAIKVRNALYKIASRLHDNPSRSQHLLASAVSSPYPVMGPTLGLTPLVGPYGGYRGDNGRDEASSKDFSLRLVCPIANIGGVIGKSGVIINQIRQESGANIKVDSSNTEGDDCVITVSAKEYVEDTFSPTIEAAIRLQPRCSERIERDSGLISFTTRLLVPASRIGCLIGKGGSIINEMRRITQCSIRILSKDDLPKVAEKDDEMVQISGEHDAGKDAIVQVTSRLRANLFEREGAVSSFMPILQYPGMGDGKRHGHSSGGGGYDDVPSLDNYGTYADRQGGSSSGPYGAYGGYASGRSSGSGSSVSRRRDHDY